MRSSRLAQVAVFLAVAVAVQLLAVHFGRGYLLTQLTMSAYYTLVVIGLSLLMGFAGQISLGHAGFFAVGGYTSAALTTWDLSAHGGSGMASALASAGVLVSRPDLYGGQALVVHAWAAFGCAVALSAMLAFLVGIPVLRLKGHYLAMATLGVGTIIFGIALGTQPLGAADGIFSVPPFQVLPGLAVGGSASVRVSNYYLACALLAGGMLLLLNLIDSRVGRALRAIHGAEDAARAMGVDTAGFKLRTFVLSAVMAAVAGAFLTHYNGGIGPSEASIMKSVKYVAIVAVGGMGSLWGTLSTSLALNYLSLRGYFGSFDDAVFGGILILVMLLAPGGVLAVDVRRALGPLLRRVRRRPAEAGREAGAAGHGAEPADAEPPRAAGPPPLRLDEDVREERG
jgi:branched-chain amino acid transport system permease protein